MKRVNLNWKLPGILVLGVIILSLMLSACSSSGGSSTTSALTSSSSTSSPANGTVNAGKSSVSAVPSANSVKAGDKFDVSIRIANESPTRGVQFSLSWDPTKLQCDSATQGDYFANFVQAHDGGLFNIPSDNPAPDNSTGKFPKSSGNSTYMAVAMTGIQLPDGSLLGVSGGGDVWVLHMTVKTGASGTANLTLSDVKLVDPEAKDLKAAVNNSKVTISP